MVAIDSDEEINGLPELDAIADTVDHDVIDKLLRKIKRVECLLGIRESRREPKEKIQVAAFMAQPDAARLEKFRRRSGRGR